MKQKRRPRKDRIELKRPKRPLAIAMSSTSSPTNDSTPLLRPRLQPPQSPSSLSLLLSRATRRGGGGPSALVRETAARQLEERRADWGYSRPVVALDIAWNSLFVVVSIVMLILTVNETPNVPVRVWVIGYAAQCVVHVVLVWVEFKRRNGNHRNGDDDMGAGEYDSGVGDDDDDSEEGGRIGSLGYNGRSRLVWVKRCESLNTMVSFMWWIIGFYWVLSGGQILLTDAPRLYWLTVVFLAFDVLFAIFCIVMACLIGIAICCCLPCIIAVLYAIAGQEGASDADLSILPKYKFQICSDDDEIGFGAGKMVPVKTSSGQMTSERLLLPEDAECCICLSAYEDGTELHGLPCNHHFHAACIAKWLKMNATCPLCKYNILKGNEQV